jgi:crotonobetainyl-CoA:carnitine CoA-transferase CaiB-like acyl-CoA transferase
MNSDKRGITLDLKDSKDVAWLMEEVGRSDVLVHNMRPGVMEELGLGPDVMLAKNPRLIYAAIWALGRTGPLKLNPGFEPMVQAFSGLMAMNGDEDSPPTRVGTSLLDFGTGMWAAMGALAGIIQRGRTGRGCVVDASLLETALGWLTGHFASSRISGEVPVRHRTGSSRLIPFEGFETKNGEIIIAAGNDRLFAKLAAALGHPEWATDPRYAKNTGRSANKADILGQIREIIATRTKGEWVDILEAAGVPCAPIHSLPEIVEHPQTKAINMLQPVPGAENLELVALPLNFDGEKPRIRRAPPRLGEHNEEVRGRKGEGT